MHSSTKCSVTRQIYKTKLCLVYLLNLCQRSFRLKTKPKPKQTKPKLLNCTKLYFGVYLSWMKFQQSQTKLNHNYRSAMKWTASNPNQKLLHVNFLMYNYICELWIIINLCVLQKPIMIPIMSYTFIHLVLGPSIHPSALSYQ